MFYNQVSGQEISASYDVRFAEVYWVENCWWKTVFWPKGQKTIWDTLFFLAYPNRPWPYRHFAVSHAEIQPKMKSHRPNEISPVFRIFAQHIFAATGPTGCLQTWRRRRRKFLDQLPDYKTSICRLIRTFYRIKLSFETAEIFKFQIYPNRRNTL